MSRNGKGWKTEQKKYKNEAYNETVKAKAETTNEENRKKSKKIIKLTREGKLKKIEEEEVRNTNSKRIVRKSMDKRKPTVWNKNWN